MRNSPDTASGTLRLPAAVLAALALSLLYLFDLLSFTDLGHEVFSRFPEGIALFVYAFALSFLSVAAALLLLSLLFAAPRALFRRTVSSRAELLSRLGFFALALIVYYGWTAGRRLSAVFSPPPLLLIAFGTVLFGGSAFAAFRFARKAPADRLAGAAPAALGGLIAFRLLFFSLDYLFFTPLCRRVLPWAVAGLLLSLTVGAAAFRFLLDPGRRERFLRPLERIAPVPAALLLLAAGAAFLWELREPGPPEAAAPGGGAAGKNVVLIVVDALRADRISEDGYAGETAPRFDELAGEGARFENCYAAATWTKPSVASLLTSLYPDAHGARRRADRLPAEARTLPEILRESGWFTAAVVANPNLKSVFGFDQGFAVYDDSLMEDRLYEIALRSFPFFPGLVRISGKSFDITDRDNAERVNRRIIPFLESLRGRPFFLYLHYMDPHFPYRPPREFSDLFPPAPGGEEAARYDAEIRFVDDRIGVLIDRLKALDLYDRSVIVVTADHGEAFGEHSDSGHGHTIFEEMVRVPLIIRGAGEKPAARIVRPVRSIDIMPTILDLLSLPPDPTLEGTSLLPLLRSPASGRESGPDIFIDQESFDGKFRLRGMIREGRWKYIRDESPGRETGGGGGREELYDLSADPGEKANLAGEKTDILRELRDAIRRHREDARRQRLSAPPAALDKNTVDQIKALGYM